MIKLTLAFSLALALAPLGRAQTTLDIEAEMKKALAEPPKSPAQMKEMLAEQDKEEAAEKAGEKAAAQAALSAEGPTVLPPWTPPVPQFTPAGPLSRKMVDGQPRVVLSGTSPMPAEALCDAWDTFKREKFSHERTGSDVNHHVHLRVKYRNGEDNSEVTMEVDRKPGAKVTQVTVSSPLPAPSVPSGQ